ncbi:hypothetical protein L4K91_004487 [Salmonella enterica]|nr:hypothetical protein [Salmonella enterica]EDX5289424.1 hypothetical protein [Salmonella enterica subsp. enterica serovar Javiana]ECV2890804.1 hypothetical protein [Salmonella enterica]EFR7989706.1 hypothetical protein [Salmonella enterica]EGH6051904.1 hypothetical protein [Salmonella enterica]
MMLPSELITNENEFKHSCSVYGKEAVKILRYIQNQWKDQTFTEKADNKANALRYQVRNIELIINEIADANTASAPISTI